MKVLGLSFAFVAALIVFTGCSQDMADTAKSTLRIKLPEFKTGSGKVSAASGAACFAISITGENIPENDPGDCDPSFGKFYGLAPAGGTLAIEGIPRSDSHKIDIFYVPSAAGCVAMDASQGLGAQFGGNRVHAIADKKPLGALKAGDNVIQISVQLPSDQNTLAALGYSDNSAACSQSAPVVSMFGKPFGMVSGNSKGPNPGEVKGTMPNGDQIIFKIKNNRFKLDQPTDFAGKITPYRLGEQ